MRNQQPGGVSGHSSSEPSAPRSTDDVSLLRIVNVLLAHRRLMVGLPLALSALVLVVTLVLPRTYTSQASFMPQGDQESVSRLAGLASQFGVDVPNAQSGQSPQFYADLMVSRELLRTAVETRYELGALAEPDSAGPEVDLVEFFKIDRESRELAVTEAIERLREAVRVRTDPETSVVELDVVTEDPVLSQRIANRLLELVNRFNLERRQSQASAERAFVAEQLDRAESRLRAAEDSLERFLERNRGYENSPTLMFEHDRLQRRVTLRQQLYTSLQQSYQQASIEEVRNTPVVTVVDRPATPARPDERRLLFRVFLGLLVGVLFAAFWALGREILRGAREDDPDDFAEYVRLRAEALDELRRLASRVPGVGA